MLHFTSVHFMTDKFISNFETEGFANWLQFLTINTVRDIQFYYFLFDCRYLSDNTSIDPISLKLRDVCPKLYHNEDAACTKVSEL